MNSTTPITTNIGTSTEDTITVCGYDLVDELMGNIDAAELLYLEIMRRLPTKPEAALLNAIIVALAEHGMMPSVIAARLTILGAPESFQGALASGLLGVGDTFVGPTANVARMLQVEALSYGSSSADQASNLVEKYFEGGKRVPGLGHPHHEVDPRAEKLLKMQRSYGLNGRHTELMLRIHEAAKLKKRGHLTLNATAAVGAIVSDLGIDWRSVRGIGLVARSIGLVGHIFEEIRSPSGRAIWTLIENNTVYVDPRT